MGLSSSHDRIAFMGNIKPLSNSDSELLVVLDDVSKLHMVCEALCRAKCTLKYISVGDGEQRLWIQDNDRIRAAYLAGFFFQNILRPIEFEAVGSKIMYLDDPDLTYFDLCERVKSIQRLQDPGICITATTPPQLSERRTLHAIIFH